MPLIAVLKTAMEAGAPVSKSSRFKKLWNGAVQVYAGIQVLGKFKGLLKLLLPPGAEGLLDVLPD